MDSTHPPEQFDEPPAVGFESAAMPAQGEAAASPSTEIAGARDRNESMLLATAGVVGVAIGRTPIGDDAIVVYLKDSSFEPGVPREVEGFPVEIVVTGEIDALRAE